MPMVGDNWASAISSSIISANPDLNASEQTMLEDAWKLVCGAHVTYITTNATVATVVTGTLPTGPGPAAGLGQPPAGGIT